MTYNFDPERWYEDQLRLLDLRRQRGDIDEAGYEEALREVERRYEKMLARLDGSFELRREGATD